MSKYRTAESVSPKHPDKLCDQISDAVLDAYLAQDPNSRVAVETVGSHGKVLVTGEVTSNGKVEIEPIVKRLAGNIKIEKRIVEQSPEIAQGVDTGGAGDQGIMIGYACSETPEHLPLEFILARKLNMYLFKRWPYDGKTQVTLKDNSIQSIVASFQNVETEELKQAVQQWLNGESLAQSNKVTFCINPAGNWQVGGFNADVGLTGRKLAIDNYGPRIPIGGGAFSGKDPSKVDRSAAYMARKIALDLLKSHRANEVYVELAYAIGVAEPLEATVIIDRHSQVIKNYDLTPQGIINFLDLKKPQFEKTARFGHFGHPEFSWER